MDVKFKLWFETPKGYVFGMGSYTLLKEIEHTGSLRQASGNLEMSYRHAWGIIKEIEENLGVKILVSKRGGKEGGESVLTAEGKALIQKYEKYLKVMEYCIEHPYIKPSLTVDGILVEDRKIVLIKRGREPFKGMLALPGGFVEYGERTEDAIVREFKEETGLDVEPVRVLGVYSDPKRDPRDHTVTVVYILKKKSGTLRGGDDALNAVMVPLDNVPTLAFDHNKIVDDYKNSVYNDVF